MDKNSVVLAGTDGMSIGRQSLTRPSRNVLELLHYDTGFSKAAMARELGIPEKSYYQYCRMRIEPRWDLLSFVVEVLRRHGCRVRLDKYSVRFPQVASEAPAAASFPHYPPL